MLGLGLITSYIPCCSRFFLSFRAFAEGLALLNAPGAEELIVLNSCGGLRAHALCIGGAATL